MADKLMTVDQPQDIMIVRQDKLFTVRETDWNRLKRLINECKLSIEWWSVSASVAFGVSGSAAISGLAIPIEQTSNAKLVLWLVSGAALVCAIICVIVSKGKGKVWNNRIDEVKQTVSDIENLLHKD